MRKSYLSIFAALLSMVCIPVLTLQAEESNQYAQCRKICAGDGLSCVNKCMEQSANSESDDKDNTVVVVEGNGGYEDSYDSYNRNHQAKAVKEKIQKNGKNLEHAPHLSKPSTLPHGGLRRR